MKSNENLSKVMKREFKLEDGIKEYLASLPNYQPWDEDTFSLEHPGSYLLPIDLCRFHWYSLIEIVKYCASYKANFTMDRTHFLSMSGVKKVNFDKAVFKWGSLSRPYRMADEASVWVEDREIEITDRIEFEPTVIGAVSAFFLVIRFPRFCRYWHSLYGCDHNLILHESDLLDKRNEREQLYKPFDFGQPYSELVPIPWGFRLELASPTEYTVRCLGDSLTSGLWDLSVSVNKGIARYENAALLYKNRRMMY